MEREEFIQRLREQRFTYQEIGNIFGISRQRIYQIVKYKGKLMGLDSLKESRRIKDHYTCQICGKVWQFGYRRLDVHHLDKELEGKNGLKYSNCKNLERMITLCHKCHLNLQHIKEKMSQSSIRRWHPH